MDLFFIKYTEPSILYVCYSFAPQLWLHNTKKTDIQVLQWPVYNAILYKFKINLEKGLQN